MVPSFSRRPGITEPIFILSPLQGCNRTQKSCSYLDNNEGTENNEDKWSSHKAESLPSPWLLILTSLNMYDYWHSWSLVSWCFHGYLCFTIFCHLEFTMSAIVNYFVVLPSPASLILLLLCLTGGAKLAFWTEYVGGVPSPAAQRILVSRSEICVVGMKSPKSEHCNIPSDPL